MKTIAAAVLAATMFATAAQAEDWACFSNGICFDKSRTRNDGNNILSVINDRDNWGAEAVVLIQCAESMMTIVDDYGNKMTSPISQNSPAGALCGALGSY